MRTYIFVFIALIALNASANSPITPLCTKGSLKKDFQGTFLEGDGGRLVTLTHNQYQFQLSDTISDAHMDLKACVVQGFQVITLTDNNPENVLNIVLVKAEAGLLSFGLGKNVSDKWPNRIRDLIQNIDGNSGTWSYLEPVAPKPKKD